MSVSSGSMSPHLSRLSLLIPIPGTLGPIERIRVVLYWLMQELVKAWVMPGGVEAHVEESLPRLRVFFYFFAGR